MTLEQQLDIFKDFWDVMQDIDEKTWVIDPEKPTRADRMRRCALGTRACTNSTLKGHCTIGHFDSPCPVVGLC